MAKLIAQGQDSGNRLYLDECARTNRMLRIVIAILAVLVAAGAQLAYLFLK